MCRVQLDDRLPDRVKDQDMPIDGETEQDILIPQKSKVRVATRRHNFGVDGQGNLAHGAGGTQEQGIEDILLKKQSIMQFSTLERQEAQFPRVRLAQQGWP
jgi:hypothetical protein